MVRTGSIVDLFERQVAETPDAPALSFAEELVSYRELNRRSNQLAQLLRRHEVRRGSVVAVCLKRSAELIESMLGILKAGGAYLPLDPLHPPHRLRIIGSDAGAAVLITDESLPHLEGDWCPQTIDLGRVRERLNRLDPNNPTHKVAAGDPAFVLFTSGSTGGPKGVLLEHRGFYNLSAVHRRAFSIGCGSRVLMFGAPSHGNAVIESVMALTNGASLRIESYESLIPGPALIRVLRDRRITHLHIPPTALAALPVTTLPDLRVLTVGGEPLQMSLVEHWVQNRRFFNTYGTTETNWLALDEMLAGELSDAPPIGRPITNMEAFIVDSDLRTVPPESPGELLIGGVGLARGYVNRPQLTTEKFLDGIPGVTLNRVYRTGDRACWLPDGRIVLMGRLDDQINIRGFRIETGEIEAVLLESPAIKQAVVMSVEAAPGDQRLQAYLVPHSGRQLSDSEIRGLLAQRLPSHMIPASLLTLDRLPLLPNGKLNRGALTRQAATRVSSDDQTTEPQTATERAISEIWSDVLGRDACGTRTSFFALGGNSLLASQVMWRVLDACGVEIPMRQFLDGPTIQELASYIDSSSDHGPRTSTETRVASHRRTAVRPASGDLPASTQQVGLWLYNQLAPNGDAYHVGMRYLIEGPLIETALRGAVEEIVRRHQALRTTFRLNAAGELLQVIRPAAAPPFQTVLLEHLPSRGESADNRLTHSVSTPQPRAAGTEGESTTDCAERRSESERLIREEFRTPFDLANGPLVRCMLVRHSHRQHEFLLNVHHIAVDGWSVANLNRELSTLYTQLASGGASLPEAPRLQYADYALRQRAQLEVVTDQQLSAWKRHLAGAPPALDWSRLPRGGSPASGVAGLHRRTIAPAAVTAADRLAQSCEGTLFMAMLSAFAIALGAVTRQSAVVVGAALGDRPHPDFYPLVGCFTQIFPLRVELQGNPTCTELLRQVRASYLHAFENSDVSLAMIAGATGSGGVSGRSPLVQASLAMQNTPAEELQLPGCHVAQSYLEPGDSRFELELQLWGRSDGGIEAETRFDEGLFRSSDVAALSERFEHVLHQFSADPSRRLNVLLPAI